MPKARARTASRAQVGKETPQKKRKLQNVVYEYMVDAQADTDEIAESVKSMLDYDAQDGMLTVLNFVVKAAGCETSMQPLAPKTAVHDLEVACKAYAPASFPLLKREFKGRFKRLFSLVIHKLASTNSLDENARLVEYILSLLRSQLRPLRHTATLAVATIMEECHRLGQTKLRSGFMGLETLMRLCTPALYQRANDVCPLIREIAVQALVVCGEMDHVAAALNDEASGVRHSVLAGLSHVTLSNWPRIIEIARLDTDSRCRRAAISLLAQESAPNEAIDAAYELLSDADAKVRLVAAESVVKHLSLASETDYIVSLGRAADTQYKGQVLAKASKVRAEELVSALLESSDQPGRVVLGLVHILAETNESAVVLHALPALQELYSRSDPILAGLFRAASLLDLAVISENGLEAEYEVWFDSLCTLFLEREDPEVLDAANAVFAARLEDGTGFELLGFAKLVDLSEQMLNTQSNNPHLLQRVARLAPFVDVALFEQLPIWKGPVSNQVKNVLFVLASRGTPQLAQRCLDRLLLSKKVPGDMIVTIYCLAKLKGYTLSPPNPEIRTVSKDVLEMAKLAEVV